MLVFVLGCRVTFHQFDGHLWWHKLTILQQTRLVSLAIIPFDELDDIDAPFVFQIVIEFQSKGVPEVAVPRPIKFLHSLFDS